MTIYKVNLEEESLLAKRFNIRSFPVMYYIKNGKIISKEHGVRSSDEIKSSVKKYLN